MLKLFKNFKTKKQLMEEIKNLNDILSTVQFINTRPSIISQKVAETLKCSVMVGRGEEYIPDEVFEKQIVNNLADQMKPYINFQKRNEPTGKKVYTGMIQILKNG